MQLFLALQPSLGNFKEKYLQKSRIFSGFFSFGTPFANKLVIKQKVSLVVNNRVIEIEGLVETTKPSIDIEWYSVKGRALLLGRHWLPKREGTHSVGRIVKGARLVLCLIAISVGGRPEPDIRGNRNCS